MTGAVDADTRIAGVGDERWSCHLDGAWNIETNPNGGYAALPVLRAMGEQAGLPDPLSVTTHFLRPAESDRDADVTARLHKRGRSTAVTSGALAQDGADRLVSVATFAELGRGADSGSDIAPVPPTLPEPGECADRFGLEQGMEIPLQRRVDVRIHPDHAVAGAGDRAELVGWVRFVDERPPDSLTLPLLADAFPPSIYVSLGPIGWVPTLEFTVQVRRRPAAGWLRARFVCEDIADDRVIEDGMLWDETGAVVARSRQIAQILR